MIRLVSKLALGYEMILSFLRIIFENLETENGHFVLSPENMAVE